MALRYDEVADLIKIVDASACDELILETDELKLMLRRNPAGARETIAAPAPVVSSGRVASHQRNPRVPPRASSSAPSAEPAPGATAHGALTVGAPMVGTFYRAASPDSPPFVEVGTVIASGDPLCVIEVMKLFTTIYAQIGGRVADICAINAELVEYDQVLFVIEDTT